MTYTQFKVYSSNDLGAPQLDGLSGSLVGVLDACLVNGYGEKSPAGWLKPLGSISSSYITAYQQPSGSQFYLYIHDAAPSGSLTASAGAPGIAGTREAWAVGYETLLGLSGSFMGTGTGRFPIPGMTGVGSEPFRTYGGLLWTKSTTLDSTPRPWIMYVDDRTLYFFVQNGVVPSTPWSYSFYGFGDFYSYVRKPDRFKCFISGRISSGNNGAESTDPGDSIIQATTLSYPFFIARNFTGMSGSVQAVKVGDAGKCFLTNTAVTAMLGVMDPVASPGNDGFVAPIEISEWGYALRGKFRGLYHITLHRSLISDGQVFSGSNHDQEKIFQVIRYGHNFGTWVVERSPVEANDN